MTEQTRKDFISNMSNIVNTLKALQKELDIKTKPERINEMDSDTGRWMPETIHMIIGKCSKLKTVYIASRVMSLAKQSQDKELNKSVNRYQLLQNTPRLRKNAKKFLIDKIKHGHIGNGEDDQSQYLDDEISSLRTLLDKSNSCIIADREDGIKTPDDWYGCFVPVDATDVDSIIDWALSLKKKGVTND